MKIKKNKTTYTKHYNIWYIHQIHTKLNKPVGYQICHHILQKYRIHLPPLSKVEVKERVELYLSLCVFMACCMVNFTIMLIAGGVLVVSWWYFWLVFVWLFPLSRI
jgi:hypothetical protein